MFVRSDMLLRDKHRGVHAHVISFGWDGFEPRMYLYEAAKGEVAEIDLWSLSLDIGAGKRCVGSFTRSGYAPCPTASPVSTFAQCSACAKPFLPELSCLFEPQCDGSLCRARFCQQEHGVYLAFHAGKVKVGMCTARRIEERAIEQGADAYAVVARVRGRLNARNLERAISSTLGIGQRIGWVHALEALASPVPWDDIMERYGMLRERLMEEMCLGIGRLHRLDRYPIPLRLTSVPRTAEIVGRHTGTIIGIKGKVLVYENNGLHALSMMRLVARDVRIL
ncbi:MAG: DUF2797 domain-containing protein [Candidatus Thermoplasmatota archaeon]